METKKEIIFISSYPPRECGIATYSQDLIQAIENKFGSSFSVSVCALDNGMEKRAYPFEVKHILNTNKFEDYFALAELMNADDSIACICLQHEFGLFSGNFGEDLLYFLSYLNKPIITSFHTVLPDPCMKRLSIVKTLVVLSESVIVSTQTSAKILKEAYGIVLEKVVVIPHGTHQPKWKDKSELKTQYKLDNRLVLSTFGLLSSNKGIETALDALPAIKKRFPTVLYVILGKTHPEVIRNEGENYRKLLEEKVVQLGLKEHVLFINKYLTLSELLNYLTLTDIYLFTSTDPNQAVSGTFAYAMSCGCPIIATPIPHAKEMVSGGTGVLVDFGNSHQLAEAGIRLLADAKLRREMGRNALHLIKASSWENVAIAHVKLFNKFTKPVLELVYTIPEISLQHIYALTNRSGIIQFCDLNMPDIASGYTLDDNARALIALSGYYKMTKDKAQIRLMDVYLNFIKFCQQPDGKFFNYVDQNGKFDSKNSKVNLEDANGRTIWALGAFLSGNLELHPYFFLRAENIFEKALDNVYKLTSPRAISFAIKGLYLNNKVRDNLKVKFIIHVLSKKLQENYYDNFDQGWEWFEQYLTYANSTIPEAMLYAYLSSGDEMYKIIAKDSFDFLISKIFTADGIHVISNVGWHQRGTEMNKYGEQPIDIAYTILTLQAFYEVFRQEKYKELANKAFSWFLGNNHLNQVIYNSATGGSYDGLEEKNVNLNQGAESTICYLLARLAMKEMYSPIPDERSEEQHIPNLAIQNRH